MDANKLAHEIHRRRRTMDPDTPRHAAAGIARFCSEHGLEPTTDDFDSYLNLLLVGKMVDDDWLPAEPVLSLITSDTSIWEIKDTRVFTHHVFTRGERLAETEIVGWLPESRVLAAPQVRGRRLSTGITYLVDEQCIFPMPESFDLKAENFGLKEPEMEITGVWDYDLHALWTPLGFHVYDRTIAKMVAQTDLEMSK
jgi:hypothetical protein